MVRPTRILRDFTGWTSAHGLPHIGNARSIALRLFWALVCVLCLGMLVFQVVVLVLNYLRYDVTVQTELKFEERDFPAVTICNINPFKKTQMHLDERFEWMLSNYTKAIELNATKTHEMWGFQDYENNTVGIHNLAKNHLIFIASDLKENNESILNQIIFERQDFVLNCAYNTKPCNMEEDFKQTWNPIYGACYTFNTNQPAKYKSKRAGPLYGVRILVKSNQSEYLATTESVGVRVSVHGQKEEPFPDSMGYNAAAGFTSAFGIKYIRTERMDHPYGNCTHGEDVDNYLYTGEYSTEGCFRSCLQNHIIATCGCADPRLALPHGWKFCTIEDSPCVNKFTSLTTDREFSRSVLSDCPCQQPCIESTHAVTVSTALWPAESYTPSECTEDTFSWNGEAECRKWYGLNTLLIEVFYERMNYQLLIESEAYSLVQLISDIGGQLGLWMGISVITMVEVLSLLLALGIFYGLKRKPEDSMDDEKEGGRKISSKSRNSLYPSQGNVDGLNPPKPR